MSELELINFLICVLTLHISVWFFGAHVWLPLLFWLLGIWCRNADFFCTKLLICVSTWGMFRWSKALVVRQHYVVYQCRSHLPGLSWSAQYIACSNTHYTLSESHIKPSFESSNSIVTALILLHAPIYVCFLYTLAMTQRVLKKDFN